MPLFHTRSLFLARMRSAQGTSAQLQQEYTDALGHRSGSPTSRNSSSASMAAASLQRQAAMSGAPQSTTVPSALTGMRAKPRASSATPPQRSAGWSAATASLAGGGSGAGSFGSVSHALHERRAE